METTIEKSLTFQNKMTLVMLKTQPTVCVFRRNSPYVRRCVQKVYVHVHMAGC